MSRSECFVTAACGKDRSAHQPRNLQRVHDPEYLQQRSTVYFDSVRLMFCPPHTGSARFARPSRPMESSNSARTTLQAPTNAADPWSVTLIQSVNNRIRYDWRIAWDSDGCPVDSKLLWWVEAGHQPASNAEIGFKPSTMRSRHSVCALPEVMCVGAVFDTM